MLGQYGDDNHDNNDGSDNDDADNKRDDVGDENHSSNNYDDVSHYDDKNDNAVSIAEFLMIMLTMMVMSNSDVDHTCWGGDVAQLIEYRTGTPPTLVRFPGAARDFSSRVNFLCRLSYGVRTSPCAIACIHICAHVKNSVVHVRVRWIFETLKHPACTVGWVA